MQIKTIDMQVLLLNCLLLSCCYLSKNTVIGNEETAINEPINHNKVIICYVAIWSVVRTSRGQFTLDSIDPTLCTHVIFAYSNLNDTNDQIITLDTWKKLLGDKPANEILKLKTKNPKLKALVCIGGWLDGSIKYSQMAANPQRRQRFINNTLNFIRQNGFDGLDLVWQHPSKRGGSARDKETYIQLLKELKSAFSKYDLTLTACVDGSKDTIDFGYDVPKLSEYLDYMLVYAYDYHGWWSRMTGANAPLKGSDFLNVEYTISYLLKLGADPNKLILGVPTFARSFTLNDTESFNKDNPQFGQKFIGHGFQGSYTEEEGFLGYNEVCILLKNSSQNWTVYWDKESDTPIAVFEDKMISFDDAQSISLKVDYALKNGLGGCFIYALDVDDFQGDCGKKYPLLNTIRDELSRYKYEPDKYDNNIYTSAIRNVSNVRYRLSYVFSLILIVSVLVFWRDIIIL